MRIVRYLSPQGPRWGALHDDRIVPLAAGATATSPEPDELFARARQALAAGAPADAGLALTATTLLVPLEPTATVYCVGLNYKAHASEAGRELPANPSLFLRRHASLVGARQPLIFPGVSQQLDFEGELAVVIARGGRHIPPADALRHIGAYTCFNDGSVRDFQRHSVTAGKNFEASGACGPWLVSADEVVDPAALHLRTLVNGVEMQSASTGQLIHPIATLISYVSRFAQLHPGDLIATGTPEGVGAAREPPCWLRPGDRVEVEISGIGTLENRVIAPDQIDGRRA